jgi:hypothetical protein
MNKPKNADCVYGAKCHHELTDRLAIDSGIHINPAVNNDKYTREGPNPCSNVKHIALGSDNLGSVAKKAGKEALLSCLLFILSEETQSSLRS